MERLIPIEERAKVLLTPKETLNLQLFDFGEQMLDDVRALLLQNADYVVRSTVGLISGLEIKDVLLDGSMAGYFYHDNSDINIRIEVLNKNNPYLTDDCDTFDDFLDTLFLGALRNFKFNINNCPVHIKLKSTDNEPMGLYSVLNDKWLIQPNWHFADNLTVDEIMTEYRRRYQHSKDYLAKLKENGLLADKKGIEGLIKYFMNIHACSTSSPKEYIVYKLLNYRGLFMDIKKLIAVSQKSFLSLT